MCSDSSTALLWEWWSSEQLCLCGKAFALMTIGSPVGFLSNKDSYKVACFLEVKSGVGSCAGMQSVEPQQLPLSPGHHP